jgi:hypothetical protein
MTRAMVEIIMIQTLRNPIVCKISDSEFSKLRIARAYIKLLCIPEGDAKIITLARIGSFEVRMFEASQNGSTDRPLFCMELFDRDAQSSVETRACYEIEDGVAAYQNFISR